MCSHAAVGEGVVARSRQDRSVCAARRTADGASSDRTSSAGSLMPAPPAGVSRFPEERGPASQPVEDLAEVCPLRESLASCVPGEDKWERLGGELYVRAVLGTP